MQADGVRRLWASLVRPDRRRRIDSLIDYFGGARGARRADPSRGMEAGMDLNVYTLEYLVRQRLEEMRASQAAWRRIEAEQAEPRALRVVLGHALIRLGRRMQPAPGGRGLGTVGGSDAQGGATPGVVRG